MMEYDDWDINGGNCKNEIEEHGNKMIDILTGNNNYLAIMKIIYYFDFALFLSVV